MDCKKIFKALGDDFRIVESQGHVFDEGTLIYVKEISKGIYLMFNADGSSNESPIQAVIADYDCAASVGCKSPKQLLFHLRITGEHSLKYLKSFLKLVA